MRAKGNVNKLNIVVVLRNSLPRVMLKIKLFLFTILICWQFRGQSQSITITSTEQKGSQIYITYDLTGPVGRYDVRLFIDSASNIVDTYAAFQRSQGRSSSSSALHDLNLKSVTGDIGPLQKVGKNKQVVWDVIGDRFKLVGEYTFEIIAVKIDRGSKQGVNKVEYQRVYNKNKVLSYTPDESGPFNVKLSFNPYKAIGAYVGVRYLPKWRHDFAFKIQGGDIISHDGSAAYGDWGPVIKTESGSIYLSTGLTKMISYPLWISAGLGIGWERQAELRDNYFTSGQYFETVWINNEDSGGFRFYPEVGLHLKILNNVVISSGVTLIDKKITPRVGFGIAFY